jgi:hypothetical protein
MKGYRMRAKPPRADGRRPGAAALQGAMLIDCEGLLAPSPARLALAGGSLRPVFQAGRGGSTPVGPGE